MCRNFIVLILLVLQFYSPRIHAITWTNSNGGVFNDPRSWDASRVPSVDDTEININLRVTLVIFPYSHVWLKGNPFTVLINSPTHLPGALNIGGASSLPTLQIAAEASFSRLNFVSGTISIQSSTLSITEGMNASPIQTATLYLGRGGAFIGSMFILSDVLEVNGDGQIEPLKISSLYVAPEAMLYVSTPVSVNRASNISGSGNITINNRLVVSDDTSLISPKIVFGSGSSLSGLSSTSSYRMSCSWIEVNTGRVGFTLSNVHMDTIHMSVQSGNNITIDQSSSLFVSSSLDINREVDTQVTGALTVEGVIGIGTGAHLRLIGMNIGVSSIIVASNAVLQLEERTFAKGAIYGRSASSSIQIFNNLNCKERLNRNLLISGGSLEILGELNVLYGSLQLQDVAIDGECTVASILSLVNCTYRNGVIRPYSSSNSSATIQQLGYLNVFSRLDVSLPTQSWSTVNVYPKGTFTLIGTNTTAHQVFHISCHICTNATQGHFIVDTNAQLTFTGQHTIFGDFRIDGDVTIRDGRVTISDSWHVNGDVMLSNAILSFHGAECSCSGSVLVTQSLFSPGDCSVLNTQLSDNSTLSAVAGSPQTSTFSMDASSTYRVELKSQVSPALRILDYATLNGRLAIYFIDGFTLTDESEVVILWFRNTTGDFVNVFIDAQDPTALALIYDATEIRIKDTKQPIGTTSDALSSEAESLLMKTSFTFLIFTLILLYVCIF